MAMYSGSRAISAKATALPSTGLKGEVALFWKMTSRRPKTVRIMRNGDARRPPRKIYQKLVVSKKKGISM
jgi:hypothetical protein